MRFDPRRGAGNLLVEAIGAKNGQRLAIVAEDPALGIYDGLVPICVADVGREMGLDVEIIPVGNHAGVDDIPAPVMRALRNSDHVLFHASLGDTLRFSDIPGGATKTMSYALDIGALGGAGCTLSHQLLRLIQAAYEEETDAIRNWRITCPLGTDISGVQDVGAIASGEADNFTITRFPVCAPRPIACNTANGVVAVGHWLIPTGNRLYDDSVLILDEPVSAFIEAGKIRDIQGSPRQVAIFRKHYNRVGKFFDLDPYDLNSWHAGMNPGVSYALDARSNVDRWGRVTFANPRYLHFHTCGDQGPGEIAWSIFDASISFDDRLYWDKGKFVYLERPEIRRLILQCEGAPESLEIRRDIGID